MCSPLHQLTDPWAVCMYGCVSWSTHQWVIWRSAGQMEQVGRWQCLSSGRRAEPGRTGSVPLEGGLGGSFQHQPLQPLARGNCKIFWIAKWMCVRLGAAQVQVDTDPTQWVAGTTFRPLRHGARLSLLRPQLSPGTCQTLGSRQWPARKGARDKGCPLPTLVLRDGRLGFCPHVCPSVPGPPSYRKPWGCVTEPFIIRSHYDLTVWRPQSEVVSPALLQVCTELVLQGPQGPLRSFSFPASPAPLDPPFVSEDVSWAPHTTSPLLSVSCPPPICKDPCSCTGPPG